MTDACPGSSRDGSYDERVRNRESEFLLETTESRRRQADSFAWTVPGLAIAGQAFLLSIALAPDTEPLGRLLASLAGLVALIASGHLMAKQVYNFDVFEAVIERERKNLSLPGVQMDALRGEPDSFPASFPENTSYVKRKWWRKRLLRHWFAVRWKAVFVWAIALAVLAAVDCFLIGYSIYALAHGDPGWFSPDPSHVK